MPTAERLKLSPADQEYVWQQLKISYRYHERFVRAGRRNIEYREDRRFTSFVAEEFEDRGREGPRIGRVPINLFAAFHRALLPTLTMAQWRAAAETRQSGYYPMAQRSEDHINWAHEITYWDEEVNLTTIDFLDYGRGVMRTGIGPPFSMRPLDLAMQQPIYDPATGKQETVGSYLGAMARESTTGKPSYEEDRHIPLGHRRFPAGVPWQQAQSTEDVWTDFRCRTPDDAAYMVQKHYLTERQTKALFKQMKLGVNTDSLTPYTLQADWRYLETELDKRRGDQWEQLEGDLASFPLFKFYEFWWREEDLWLLLVNGQKKPLEIRRWPAPLGKFPYRFLDVSTRLNRPTPISEFNGLVADQDQINIFNSMATDAARRMKTLVLFQKQLLENEERKKIERAGPLSTIGVRHDVEKVLKLVQLEQKLDQWVDTIIRLEANARRRFGIIQEQLGSPSDVDTATQSMMIKQGSSLQNDARIKRVKHFLKRTCEDHQEYSALAWNRWPQAGGRSDARMYRGAMGLPKEGGGYYPMEEGFTYDEIHQKLRWGIDVIAQSPADRQEKIERIERWANIAYPSGVVNMRKTSLQLFELYEINRTDLLNPDPEDFDPAEEHAQILAGKTPQLSPYEDHGRHLQKHEMFLEEVLMLEQLVGRPQFEQAMQQATPNHRAFVGNFKAQKLLAEHIEITRQISGRPEGDSLGKGQGSGQSLEDGAVASGRARMSAKSRNRETQTDVPPTVRNTPLGDLSKIS